MVRKLIARRANSHHTLLTNAWTANVQALEKGIGEFDGPAARKYHVSLFEMEGDSMLHVNVTHTQEMKPAQGWSGPGVTASGFVHNRRFDSPHAAEILRSIRQMVFAAPA
jgi:hypothetical protein